MDIILVDHLDNQIGTMEKIGAHENGSLHRAFSIFIFNKRGELLLQKRASEKYHSGGIWTNTCCSHPSPGKDLLSEAKKRLSQEMGMQCSLKKIFSFLYFARLGCLTENEFDHVFIGRCDQDPHPDSNEVQDWRWMNIDAIAKELSTNPEQYTPWFRACFQWVRAIINSENASSKSLSS